MKNIQLLIFLALFLFAIIFLEKSFNPVSTQKISDNSISNEVTPTATISSNLILEDLVYPGSIKLTEKENFFSLESYDNPRKITDWYESKIEEKDLKVRTFLRTNSNENILNRVVGIKGQTKITIDVTKKNTDERTKISVAENEDK